MGKRINRRDFIKAVGAAGAGLAGLPALAEAAAAQRPSSGRTAAALAAPPMEKVRVGFIGVGARGSGHVEQMLLLDGVEIKAICDNHEPTALASVKRCVDKGRTKPDAYTIGDLDYRRMHDRDDIDIIFISTPWELHTAMAVDAMKKGKHVFIEVPAAVTLDECWNLVETAERAQKHCMMMENVCYGREELMVLNMCRLGVFGELLHGEAAYIHDLRGQMHEVARGTGSWRTVHYMKRNGNLYPTHGLGPVAQYMNINRGDKMDHMSSMSSNSRVREIYARKNFPADHKWNKGKFVCGDINTSIVQTALGKTIMVQWDEQLPRPYTRHNLVQGTKGVWAGFPDRTAIEGSDRNTGSWQQGGGLKEWYDKYDHPLWKRIGDEAKRVGGHGGMDFVMLWRIVHCLRSGLPMDQDVYDAASWSAIAPLSEWSVARKGRVADIPDFTRGQWKSMKPLAIAT